MWAARARLAWAHSTKGRSASIQPGSVMAAQDNGRAGESAGPRSGPGPGRPQWISTETSLETPFSSMVTP